MEAHSLATLFPLMGPAEYAEIRASIKERGLLEPITLYEGKILDGRNRWRACSELGIKPKTVEYEGDDPLGFVLAKNLHRRHLSESQQAMALAKAEAMGYRRTHGGDRRSEKFQGSRATLENKPVAPGKTSIKAARVVLAKGSPELVAAVEQDRVAVSAARQIAALPRRDQIKIANEKDPKNLARMVRDAKERVRSEPRPEPPLAEMKLTSTRSKSSDRKRYYTVREWEQLDTDARKRIVEEGFEAQSEKMNEQTGSSIEWARWSHNTVTGCLHNCPYCYARDIAERLYPQKFVPVFHPSRLAGPGSVEIPEAARRDESYRNVFANSMSDLFGQWVPADWIEAAIEMARRNPKWNFLTLTKFPQRAADFDFPKNWWMGTTVDAQSRVENAEKAFAKIRCGTKWLSLEPLLEPLRFKHLDLFQWVVIGGASQSTKTPEYRPPYRWAAELTLEATKAGCRVYHKTNLGVADATRLREFPWVKPNTYELPRPLRYLKGMQ